MYRARYLKTAGNLDKCSESVMFWHRNLIEHDQFGNGGLWAPHDSVLFKLAADQFGSL
jgi:hypothetical protein